MRSQRSKFDLYLADTRRHDAETATRLAVLANEATHDPNNQLAQVMISAADVREALDILQNHIDAHEKYAGDNPESCARIQRDLEATRKDIEDLLSWYLSESRQAMSREREYKSHTAHAV